MQQNLRSVDRPEGSLPPPGVLERVPRDRDILNLNQQPKAAGGRGTR
jgi:hypothetical protein